jgi:pyridoxal phosphate enzyme (YggS family)
MPDLVHNLHAVSQRIALAAQLAGRDPRSVALLAVSKTFPAEDVRAAHAAGQRMFGENYVQESLTKIEALADLRASLEWHFIGPLQSNKTRPVAENFDWVHWPKRSRRRTLLPPCRNCVCAG